MRMTVVGALMVAGLIAVAVKPDVPMAFGERMEAYRPLAEASHLVAYTTTVGDKYEQLMVIDSVRKVILVYHVDLSSGDVELRSARNIEPDLQLDRFNGKPPFPTEIRQQLGYR